ncbi:MAG: transporter permease, partial [Rhodoferax sp.]|nr:transporter permease [Rhodoferax sp.]
MTGLMLKISGAWLFTILAGLPLFASMGLAALVFLYLGGMPITVLPQKMAGSMNSFPIIAAPLFILMGNILGAARITDRIVEFASTVIGWVRGGYAHASVLTSMIFAGMVGSAVADAAGSGAIEIRAMRNAGYKPETAAAITAAAATIGPIIPPSLPMVIYGVTDDVSIGTLFMAGVVPGVLMGVSLMVMVGNVARKEVMARKP